MLSLHCPYCGWSFNLTGDEAAAALAETEQAHGKTYTVHCPRCRRANKISLQQLRKGATAAPPASAEG